MELSGMDKFCGSTFWDWNLSWNTTDPDITPCFEKTFLVWIPCLFLWLFSPLEIYYLLNSKYKDIPWNWFNMTKVAGISILCITSIFDIVYAIIQYLSDMDVFSVDIYTPLVKLITFGFVTILICANRAKGLRSSGLIFLFWLSLAFFGMIQYRTELRLSPYDVSFHNYPFISYMVYYPVILIELVLSFFADAEPKKFYYESVQVPCPELKASFPSKILFSWFDSFIWSGYKRPIESEDLWNMNYEDSSQEVVSVFYKHWERSLIKAKLKVSKKAGSVKNKTDASLIELSPSNYSLKNHYKVSILPVLCKSFGSTFLFGSFLRLIMDCLIFVSPQVLKYLISFIGNSTEPLWKGYFYTFILMMTAMLQTFIYAQHFHRVCLVGMRIRTALTLAIYRKTLRISNIARKSFTTGEIVNLMAVDAHRFIDLIPLLNFIWSAPFQICLAVYSLWQLLGPSVLAGIVVMILLIPINAVVANKSMKLQGKQMTNKDQRLRLMNEILSGIKVLKLNAWEPCFEQKILDIRGKEINVLRSAVYLNAATSFIWTCAPLLVSLLTYTVYILSDKNNILDAETAFVSLSLFYLLRYPLSLLPKLVSSIVEDARTTQYTYILCERIRSNGKNIVKVHSDVDDVSWRNWRILRKDWLAFGFCLIVIWNDFCVIPSLLTSVSVKRINKFMNAEELYLNSVTHNSDEKDPLVIENGTFTWGDPTDTPTLSNINLRVSYGKLVAVVGTVGSGKSSLVSAFLGEMEKVSGRANTKGSIAYVPQQAWIQNKSLKDNILFGQAFNDRDYKNVIDACALKDDFQMLPAGDDTEIGEKGINLSGGQKQRVSLARAVYKDSDIYFLDDPLSAVDSHVGKHIFEHVIGPTGLLRKKTRILVTHSLTYLREVDLIVVMKDGQVSEAGTYKELIDKRGDFADFLLLHMQEQNKHKVNEIEMNKLLEDAPADLKEKYVKQQSEINSNSSMQTQISIDTNKPISRSMVEQKAKLIESEKAETGYVKWDIYIQYIKSIGPIFCITSVLLIVLYQGFSISSNIWLSIWSNDDSSPTQEKENDNKRLMHLTVFGILGFGQIFTSLASSITFSFGTILASEKLFKLINTRIFKNPLSLFDTTPIGRILNRLSKDMDTIDNVLPLLMRLRLQVIVLVIATLIIISYSTPIFTTIIIPTAIIYYIIQRFYIATSRQLKRLESISRSPLYSHFSETIAGAKSIRAYGAQSKFTLQSEQIMDFSQSCYYPKIVAERWMALRVETIGNFIIFFASLFAVLGRDKLSPGIVGLSISNALQITQALNLLVRVTSDVETNIVAVERIKEYGETPQEAAWEVPSTQPPKEWPTRGEVQFKNLKVRYREGLDLVLKGLDLIVEGGQKVGIVGRTGAGKSSLTLSLFRIVEAAEGSILIDGVDISKIGLHTLRNRLTIIPQDPVLFSGTLRMNLDPTNSNTDAQLWSALTLVNLKSYVVGLASGLDYEVSEGGGNLSVGQRQLVCLARALLKKTKILVLDEATASIDLDTDHLIQATIRSEFKDCTVLTIAHRLNTIMDSDKVIVLDNGLMIEYDSPANLLQDKSSVFYSMAKDTGLAT